MQQQLETWRSDFEQSVATLHEGFEALTREQTALREQQAALLEEAGHQRADILNRQQQILDGLHKMQDIFQDTHLYITTGTSAIDFMRAALREQAAAQREVAQAIRRALGVGAIGEAEREHGN